MRRFILAGLVLGALGLFAAEADAGPLRNFLSRLRGGCGLLSRCR